MSADAAIERALRKQRLQLKSAALRTALAEDARGLAPVCAAVDGVGQGLCWLRAHPQVVVGTTVALLVARPQRVWRWGRRLWWAWRTARRAMGAL